MEIKVVLKKELFEKGVHLFGIWDKLSYTPETNDAVWKENNKAWEDCRPEFEEFRDEVHYLWNSLFRGIGDNAINYIRSQVVEDEIRGDYLQLSDLKRFLNAYFNNGITEVYSSSAVSGLAMLQTVCNKCEPWKDAQTLAKLNKKPWDIDTELVINAKKMYKEFCESGYVSSKELRDKYGYDAIKAQAERIWFGLFTDKISEQNIYDVRDRVVDWNFNGRFEAEDVEELIDNYLLDKESYFLEMSASLLMICAKMYRIEE